MVDWVDGHRQRPTGHQHDLHRVRCTESTVTRGDVLTIPMSTNGGLVLHLAPLG